MKIICGCGAVRVLPGRPREERKGICRNCYDRERGFDPRKAMAEQRNLSPGWKTKGSASQ